MTISLKPFSERGLGIIAFSITSYMFEGFTRRRIKTQAATVDLVRGGNGDPVLLLHGYPQTHACWHRVAPPLAEKFTVVCADLRGCGDSAKPESDEEHLAYSKRVMAQDQVEATLTSKANPISFITTAA